MYIKGERAIIINYYLHGKGMQNVLSNHPAGLYAVVSGNGPGRPFMPGGSMKKSVSAELMKIDRDEILAYLFYPRREESRGRGGAHFDELAIPTGDGAVIGGRFYAANLSDPTILFFHGNGEIVADYEDLASVYTRLGAGFMPVDYRGYGISTGSPSVAAMMSDCHSVFEFAKEYLNAKGHSGPLVVMGRSLGSASALELASSYPGDVAALVIESGFAYILPLMRLLGIRVEGLGVTEEGTFNHLEKIKGYAGPTLIIHAEHDHIIPLSDGRALFAAAGSKNKRFLKIPGANHNNIFMFGAEEYIEAVAEILKRLDAGEKKG